jgi:hypothetical protein
MAVLTSLTVAVNVTDCPSAAVAVEAISAVRVGWALNRVRSSRRPTWGRNPRRDASLSGRRVRRPRREGVLRNVIRGGARKDPTVRGNIVRLLGRIEGVKGRFRLLATVPDLSR